MEDSRPIAVETPEELAAPAAAFTYAPSPDERRDECLSISFAHLKK